MKMKLFLCAAFIWMTTYSNAQSLYVPNGTNGIGKSTNENVGIGLSNPISMLHIKTPNYATKGLRIDSDNAILEFGNHAVSLRSQSAWTMVPYIGWTAPNGNRQAYLGWEPNYFNLTLENGYNFSINGGNVGIGTTTPQNKLDVNGTIRAKEVKVETGWADFVFAPTYKLRPLSEVEQFIKTNGHLPEIPKAEEVQQNGVNLGEMQTKLLQKVEELTLYVIELKKENEQMKKEIENLKK